MKIFEPVIYDAWGQLVLADGNKEYFYFGVPERTYQHIKKLCIKKCKGKVYNVLKKYSNQEKAELVK